jgi:prepilin-type N-terminal cleavage/methylation domain-containing protein
MFMRLHRAMKDRDMGFTLIELLVVIIIIGILAGIAIPVFFSQRKKAVDKSVISDVTNASLSLESYYSTNNAYPTSGAQATIAANADRIVVSTGNTLKITTDGTTGYCISGTNPASNYAAAGKIYDSNKGGLQTDGAPCSTGYTNTITLP